MSRSKKSRKPGRGSIGAVKEEKPKFVEPTPKRAKKTSGNKAGNRQQEATAQQDNKQNNPANRDPRIGNKTPIVLVKKPTKAERAENKPTPAKTKPSPIAAIRMVEPEVTEVTLAQELQAIEDDTLLQTLLVKEEDDIALTEEEVDYYNEKMERHEQLRDLLGLDDEDDEEEESTTKNSEDDLWDKLDKNDLSDF